MVAIFIVMAVVFLAIGIMAAIVPYSTPRLQNLTNAERILFGAFREGFQSSDNKNDLKAYNE